MKKNIFFPLAVMVLIATTAVYVNAQMGPGMGWHSGSDRATQGQQGWSYCPYCGNQLNQGRGPDRMAPYGGRDHHMGPGMMHDRGWRRGMHQGYQDHQDQRGPYGRQYGPQGYLQEPLDKNGAEQQVKNMLEASRNPNLKVGEVTVEGDNFQVEVLTKDDALVDKLLVDKDTGAMRSIY